MAALAGDVRMRIDAEPRRGRKFWLLPPLLALLLFAAWSAWDWLTAPETFPLRAVRLDAAAANVGEAELRAAIAPHLDRGMLGLDVAAVRASLEALPWVESARVRRHWPATLTIALTQREAVARWGEDALLSDAGVLFRPALETFPEGLPLLAGPAGSEAIVAERFARLRGLFAQAGFALTALELDQRHAWTAQLDGTVRVQLDSDPAEHSVRRFVAAYAAVEPRGVLETIDLRYPNGFSLGWASARPADGNKE